MSLNQRKRQAEALLRSSWCNAADFHSWIDQNGWTCTRCDSHGYACTFSNYTTTHCDHCIASSCSARRDFRKAFFMQKFDITERLYESWMYEWRMKITPGAAPTGAYSDGQGSPSSTECSQCSPSSPSYTRQASPVWASPPVQYASPVPFRSNQGAMAARPIAPSDESQDLPSTPTTPDQTRDEDREVHFTNEATLEPGQVHTALKTSYNDPPLHPTLFLTDTTPSVMQCLDNQVKFFQTLRTVSDCHLRELMAEQGRALAKEDQIDRSRVLEQKLQESEERAQIREDEMTERILVLEQQLKESQEYRERAQANEDELKEQIWMLGQQKLRESQELQERARLREVEVNERINALEQELKESQDSQESLRSRLKAIVQDLQIEVLRDEDGSPKKRKREDAEEGELVYPYQRLCSFD